MTHKASVLPVGSGPVWMKVFNLNDDDTAFIRTNDETNDPDWVFQNGSYTETGYLALANDQPVVKALPWAVDCNGYGSCGIKENQIWLELSNQIGNYSYGIEVFKGINLIHRNIHGQRGGWGADENSDSTFEGYQKSEMYVLEY